jgi:magnesium chelatase subunit I
VSKEDENPYKSIIRWFDSGNGIDIFLNVTDKNKVLQLYKVDGLNALVKKYFPHANDTENALLMEFVLHGLAAYSMISKKIIENKIEFKDLMGSMVNLGTASFTTDDEFDS